MTARVSIFLILAGCLTAPPAQAQQLRLGIGRAESDHELLGSPLSLGGSIGARARPWLGIRVGVQYGRDDFASSGSTCFGLVLPGEDCGPELRDERATIIALVLNLALTETFGWGDVSLIPSIRRMRMRSVQEGTESGRVRRAEKVTYGFGVGLEGQAYLSRRPTIALYVSANSASHPWFRQEIIADGYTPFENGARLSWLEVGLAADFGSRD